ncbi:MAG: GTPase Era [Verrucomicrobia bacterium ADurb.Bin118]|jgi:hypothetical protein|nr:MAG: GTPase Era [Verrucomicrobia bacterium ADurb.Bin118]
MQNPEATKLRTPQTEILLKELDAVIESWRKLDFTQSLRNTRLELVMRNIDRARRQFDSKLFFVVIFGPLKAGKSTLTNALASEYVSPTGFGKETTRRPSLIISAEEPGIDQYFSTDPEINHFLSQRRLRKNDATGVATDDETQKLAKVRESFDAVADYLRGIRSKDEFQGRIRVDTLHLNAVRLEETLTQDLTTEPLLTVIRCKGDHLLRHGVAIVDMPGLDGSRSNWRTDPIHEWVMNRAEFFLFVQSSVAALNKEAHDFLKEIVAQSTKPPIWLIQNIFDARHWQPEEKRKKAEADQLEEGRQRVIKLLNEEPRTVLGLNVGLAWDAKNENQDEWLSQSKFPKFESDLADVLHAERALIQEHNCLKYLRQRFGEAEKQLKISIGQIKQLREAHKKVRDKLREAQALLDAVSYHSDWETAVRGEICAIAEAAAKPWLDSLENEVARLRERHDRKRTGKEVNGELDNTAIRLGAEGDIKHFAKPLQLPSYVKVANQYCKSAESDAITRVNEFLGELELSQLPAPVAPSAEDLPRIESESFTHDKLPERGWKNWFGGKDYDGSTLAKHIESAAKAWRQQIEKRKGNWINQVIINHFSTYCEKRRKHFQAHLQRLMADFNATAKPEEETATATENLISQMDESLRNLALPLAKARESMK